MEGDICHIHTQGTELERFSGKVRRYVLLAYQDDQDAFVYPLSTQAPKAKPIHKVETPGGATAWVVLDRGIFRVSLSELTATQVRDARWHLLKPNIRKDLEAREIRVIEHSKTPLKHEPFRELKHLKKSPEPTKPKQKEAPKLSDAEVLELYYKNELDADIRRRAHEGRKDP